jgi:osmoprotectant transport system ATP-binding protein
MITLSNVSKSFGRHRAVSDVTLSIEPGNTTALIGPSGCGKSTLLRLMIGLIEPDSGSVLLDGVRPTRQVRTRVGYAIQSGGLFPHLTARGNALLPTRHAGWNRRRAADRVAELAQLMGLDDATLDRFPSQLSGGQRQRVALMRALVLDPEALLLDEPLGALDPVIRAALQRELRNLFASLGKTVVLVTHDLAEAACLAPDDIVILRDGAIVQRGSFHALRDEPADGFVEEFVAAQTERVRALVGATP